MRSDELKDELKAKAEGFVQKNKFLLISAALNIALVIALIAK